VPFDPSEALNEVAARNTDNVTRTQSYLELYAWARKSGHELPWLLMAHLVSRNTGYLLSDLAGRIDQRRAKGDEVSAVALETLALLLERGNYVIFDDAWRHVLAHLLGREDPHTTQFMRGAWRRFRGEGGERQLVLDLVHNEQNVIERRVVHNERFGAGLRMLQLIEMSGRERPLEFPRVREPAPAITVGGFGELAKRIETGRRIFDEIIDRDRDALFAWAMERPHTGSRAVYGGPAGPGVRDVWPPQRFVGLDAQIHAALESDPLFP
jgi:hypothetical protein